MSPTSSPRTVQPGTRFGRPASALRRESGLTLIEVLISALIVGLIGSAVATSLIAASHASGSQRYRSQADMLAARDQERLRGLSDQQLATLRDQQRTVSFGAVSFTVKSVATFIDTTGASSCLSGATAYYKVFSTVSWTEVVINPATQTHTWSITEESIISRPVGGNMLVQVTDEKAQGLQGVTVNATGPSNASMPTDDGGCAVFAGLTPGSYTVALSDPGYIDPDSNASPSGTATVQSIGVAKPSGNPFHMGLAGSVVAAFTTNATNVYGEADTLSWLGSGASFGMSSFKSSIPLASPTTGTISTGATLFPFWRPAPANYSNNYSMWGGRCLQSEPPAGFDQLSVGPGQVGLPTQPSPVQEPQLNVVVNYTANGTTTQVKPSSIKLYFNTTAGAACNAYSWISPVDPSAGPSAPATGWLAHPGQPFVSNQATGANASASSTSTAPQTGYYNVCAAYGGYYVKPATQFYNNNMGSPTAVTLTVVKGTNAGSCP